jgi:hypothetical protein
MKSIGPGASTLLEEYDDAHSVPDSLLKELGLYSADPETQSMNLEWLDKNLGAIKAGYGSFQAWEDDMMDQFSGDGEED